MCIFINMSCLQLRLIIAIIVGWKRINYMIWWCYDVLEKKQLGKEWRIDGYIGC